MREVQDGWNYITALQEVFCVVLIASLLSASSFCCMADLPIERFVGYVYSRHADGMPLSEKMFFSPCCFHTDGDGHGKNLSAEDSIYPRQAVNFLKALHVKSLHVCNIPSKWGPCFCPREQSGCTFCIIYLDADLQVFNFTNC